ncbi:MAG TPA: hypothetical protein VGK00_00710 [Anaerolineales bacterium]|jgi:hypothetical protein
MSILALKLILAPIIIGGASLAGRRWGHAVSGWLIGLPLTSGPVAFFVAISHSQDFVASTVLGTLSGGPSLVAFCLVYAWLALRFRWPVAIAGSMLFFFGVMLVMQNFILPLAAIFPVVVLAILLGFWLMPKGRQVETLESKPGPWDLPARILIGTSFILVLTGVAPFIGPRLTGLLSTIPIYTAILAIFAHRLQGPLGAASVLHGLLYGLFGFAGFYLVLALLLGRVGLGLAFSTAILTTLLVQGLSFLVLQRARR